MTAPATTIPTDGAGGYRREAELARHHQLAKHLEHLASQCDDPSDKQALIDGADVAIRYAMDIVGAYGIGPSCRNCGTPNVVGNWHEGVASWRCHGVLWPTGTRLAVLLLKAEPLTPAELLERLNVEGDHYHRGSDWFHYSDPQTGEWILGDLHQHHLVTEVEPGRWTLTRYAHQLLEAKPLRRRRVPRVGVER
jgi:hypothetical protein